MKITSTGYGHDNVLHKIKGGSASLSSYPSISPNSDFNNSFNNSFHSFNSPPSFTGLRLDKIPQVLEGFGNILIKGWNGFFGTSTVKITNLDRFIDKTNDYIGSDFIKSRIETFQGLIGEQKAAKLLRINGNTLEMTESSMAQKLLNGLLDIPRILLDVPNAFLRGVKKLPFAGNLEVWNKIADFPPLKNRANEKAAMEIFYRLKGMAAFTRSPGKMKAGIFGVPAGEAVANYVTKDERSLNRLATGIVSAVFVGNDFYNLAMYEKNDSKEASKVANKRMRREASRIIMSATLTFSVLSALSSYVNKSKNLACFAIAGSALFTEVASRVMTGTPLLPLTPNGAKKLNKKRAEKKAKTAFTASSRNKNNANTATSMPNTAPFAVQVTTDPIFSRFTYPPHEEMAFKATKPLIKADEKQKNTVETENAKNSKLKKDPWVNKNKPFGLKHLAGAFVVCAAVGLLYCFTRLSFYKFDNFIKQSGRFLSKLRKLLSKKDLVVSEADLRKLLEGFDNLKCERLKKAYSSIADVEFTKEEAELLLSKAKNGVISIDKDNPIYARAFVKTAARQDSLTYSKHRHPVKIKGHIADDHMDRVEYYDLANAHKLEFTKGASVPDYVETKRNLSEIIKDLTKMEEIEQPSVIDADSGSKIVPPETDTDFTDIKKVAEPILEKSTYTSNFKFKNIRFKLNLDKPTEMVNGEPVYGMQDIVFNFGEIEDTKIKIIIDAFEKPFRYITMIASFPLNCIKKLAGIKIEKPDKPEKIVRNIVLPDVGEFYRDCTAMFKKYKSGKITREEFGNYIEMVNMKPFSVETTTRYSPTALASKARNLVALISSYFFINDFRNEVLLQSDGENKQKAAEVTKERTAHKVSNFILNKFFMEAFNNAFNKQYLSSLFGATVVAAATEITNESSVRASIGVPLDRKHSREEIDEFEKKHMEQKGIKGAYYRFMARLTGKKMLSEKATDKK